MLVSKRIPLLMFLRIDGVPLVLFTLFSGVIYCLYHFAGWQIGIPLSVVATLGTAVAILLGFKNNSAYDRWWEARKIWGGIVNQSRTFGAQLLAYLDKGELADSDPAHQQHLQELVRRHLGYINLLRQQLRGATTEEVIETWLSDKDADALSDARNKATQIMSIQATRLRHLHEGKHFDQFRLFEFMSSVREFYALQGKAERIKGTPLLRHYSFFTTAFVWLFVLFLPFGFVGQMDWKMIPLSALVSTIFTIPDRAGTYTETPFANGIHDVAMSAICRTIEIDMLQQIGIESLPEAITPDSGVLM